MHIIVELNVDIKSNTCIDSSKEINDKYPKIF